MDKPTEVSFLNIFRSLSAKVGCLFQKNIYVAISFALIYGVVLIGTAKGVGQYWDWSFPYFSDQVRNVFWSYAFSWLGSDIGAPLPYLSDYYVRMFMSLFGFLPPEVFRYLLIVTLLTLVSFGTYLILRKTTQGVSQFAVYVASLAVVCNPLVFYKLLAGHINYLISFTIFVYLVYYVLFVFSPDKRRYGLILALFFAFIGAQIQFFIFAALFLFVYFAIYKEKRSIQAVLFIVIISFLINLPWLSNFLVGGIQVSEVSAVAAKASFKDLAFESYKDIFNMTFSKATLVDRFYSPYILESFSALFILLLLFVFLKRGTKLREYHSLFLLLIFILLGIEFSAIFFSDFYYVKVLLPLFREFGHVGPVVIFFLIMSLIQWPVSQREKNILAVLLLIFVFVNIPVFALKLPKVDFSQVRKVLYPFKEKLDSDDSAYRVLTYPFFSPYSFNFLPERADTASGILLQNAGHDSFMTFSGKSRLGNLVPAHSFYNSPQYLLKSSLNLDILRAYNVKYIFDMTDVYTSEYSKYVSNELKKRSASVFEQDKSFFKELADSNPGVLRKVSDTVYEVSTVSGGVFSFSELYCIKSTEWNSVSEFDRLFGSYKYGTRKNCDPNKQPVIVNLSELTRKRNIDSASGKLSLDLSGQFENSVISLYTSTSAKGYYARIDNGYFTIYQKNKDTLQVDDTYILGGTSTKQVAYEKKIDSIRKRFYISTNNTVLAIPENVDVYMGSKADTESVTVYTDGKDVYEDAVSKRVSHKDGRKYILSFDYRGNINDSVSYEIQNEKGVSLATETFFVDRPEWHTHTKVIERLDDTEYITLALKNSDTVEYQNRKLVMLDVVDELSFDTEVGYTKRLVDLDQVDKITYQKEGFTFKNIIDNGNFEKGLWQKDAIICHKDSSSDNFGFSGLDTKEKTDGKQSLLLKAQRNVVCAKKTFSVNPGSTYVLTFDYKGSEAADVASFRIDYNDPEKTAFRDSRQMSSQKWNTYEKNIQVPNGATSATIYLFARATNKVREVSNWYDKVSMIELPPVDKSMYLVGEKAGKEVVPEEMWYKKINPTKTDVLVVKAKGPFYLGFSEAHHPDWKVRPSITKGGISANPMHTAGTLPESTHYRVNEYFNAWYIDPVDFCTKEAQSCEQHADGSYTIRLTIEFWPQRWFVIFLTISFLTLGITIFSLIHAYNFDHINYRALFRRKTPDIL